MKNTKGFGVIRRLLLILIALCLCLSGCGQNTDTPPVNDEPENETLEGGFTQGFAWWESSCRCAYRSDSRVFDINDVTLEFFYGIDYTGDLEWYLENSQNYPWFELYFIDADGNKLLVKRVEENLVSEKYQCTTYPRTDKPFLGVDFNYSETLTIPREIFNKESGVVTFCIKGDNARTAVEKIVTLTLAYIQYETDGDKVILSVP